MYIMLALLSLLTLLCVHISADGEPSKGLKICCNGTAKSDAHFAYSMKPRPRQKSVASLWPEPKNIVQSAAPTESTWNFFSSSGSEKALPFLTFAPQVCLQTSQCSEIVKKFFLHFQTRSFPEVLPMSSLIHDLL